MRESARLPIPSGWFCVGWSHELQPGAVEALSVFGRELVLFRTRAGDARVLDAHCPHLGAHLARPVTGGVGGKIVGNSIQCPFHDWQWDGTSGRCVAIPYAKRIPPNARTRAWTVVERYGMILVWHDPETRPPAFQLPVLPELEEDGFGVVSRTEREARSTPLDMGENSVDLAHFVTVHGLANYPDRQATQLSADGAVLRVVGPADDPKAEAAPIPLELERTLHGLGFATIRFLGLPGTPPVLLIATTPIDEDRSITRWSFWAGDEVAESLGVAFTDQLMKGVLPDFPIWEHKVYRPEPILCDGDGPIAEYRRWARQFFPGPG